MGLQIEQREFSFSKNDQRKLSLSQKEQRDFFIDTFCPNPGEAKRSICPAQAGDPQNEKVETILKVEHLSIGQVLQVHGTLSVEESDSGSANDRSGQE